MNARPLRLLIQCIGNPLRGDDAAGLRLGERLRRRPLPADVRVEDHWGEGTELLQGWERATEVILVDAASTGAPVGTLHRIDPLCGPLPSCLEFRGSHQFGVAEAVETARALGRLPPRLQLLAIEGSNFAAGASLSTAVDTALEQLATELTGRIHGEEDTHA